MTKLFAAVLLIVSVAAEANAQTASERGADRARRWRPEFGWQARAAFDDNVFLLRETRKDDLDGEGRYADMNSAYDVVGRVAVEGSARGPGLAGRRLELRARTRLDGYALNPRRSHADFEASAEQSLSKRDRVALTLEFAPSVFRRNYLAGEGPTYAPGVYRESGALLGYEREVIDSGPVEAEAELTLLVRSRSLEDFPWRDRRELGGRVGADLRFDRSLRTQLFVEIARHSFESVPEPVRVGTQVTIARVNRDRNEVELGIQPRLRLAKHRFVEVGYRYRIRDYVATLTEDPVFGGREDRRHTLEAEISFPFAGSLAMQAGGRWQRQNSARPGRGETGDESDYRRLIGYVQVEYPR